MDSFCQSNHKCGSFNSSRLPLRIKSSEILRRLRRFMTRKLKGMCACEAVTYTVSDDFRYAANCHCSVCRRATGSAFKPFGGIEAGSLRLSTGVDNLMVVGGDIDHDVRCATCGSYLYSVVRNGAFVHVSYGSLIDSPSLLPTEHIHVASKAPWHSICDALPQHPAFAE
jgi:hypothetical protein